MKKIIASVLLFVINGCNWTIADKNKIIETENELICFNQTNGEAFFKLHAKSIDYSVNSFTIIDSSQVPGSTIEFYPGSAACVVVEGIVREQSNKQTSRSQQSIDAGPVTESKETK